MNHDDALPSAATRAFHALLRALDPGEEICLESELLKHFPFARVGETSSQHAPLRVIPTTAPGAL